MSFQPNIVVSLENFDDVWGLGNPVDVEKKFSELLFEAQKLENKSVYLQILSQIALAQAIQQKFDEAHKTLNLAQSQLNSGYIIAHARILLERGRVFHQAQNVGAAKKYFMQSFELSEKNNLDYHTINAAHMIAIVEDEIDNKIFWNLRALELAEKTEDKRAQSWLGSIYNNLGQNFINKKEYRQALAVFKKALEYREKEGYAPNIRVAKWNIGKILRLLEQIDDALEIQNKLLNEYNEIVINKKYDLSIDMFELIRGWVYEELAELYNAKAQFFAKAAYADLSNNEMFKNTSPERLSRLKRIQEL